MMDLFIANTQFMDYLHNLWITAMFLSDVFLMALIHCRGSIGEQVMKC